MSFDYIGSSSRVFERIQGALIDRIASVSNLNVAESLEGCGCLVLDRRGHKLVVRSIEALFGKWQGQDAAFTVSLVEFDRKSEKLLDLLGTKTGGKVTGIVVTDAVSALETLQVPLSQAMADSTRARDVIATVTIRAPQVGRLHLVFPSGPGLWSHGGLPARMSKMSICMAVGDVASTAQAREFRTLWPLDMSDAYARIADLELQLKEARERLALSENAIVNQLLSTHPAFEGLQEDEVKKSTKKRFKSETTTDRGRVHWAEGEENEGNAQGLSAAPPLKRLGSTGGGGAVRVLNQTPSGKPAKNQTPGGRQKTQSRVFGL